MITKYYISLVLLVELLLSRPVFGSTAVPLQELIRNPRTYKDQSVTVIGYLDATVHHGCDIRAAKLRPDDRRYLVHVDLSPSKERDLRTLTHCFKRVVLVSVTGTFEYIDLQGVKEIPVKGDPHVAAIQVKRRGFGWMGLWDKQITAITRLKAVTNGRD